MLCLIVLAMWGCASLKDRQPETEKPADNVFAPKAPLYTQLAPGKTGDMAYAVEKLAKGSGCELYDHASLMAKRPGIQFYRVPCADGRQILYRCEIRQCREAD